MNTSPARRCRRSRRTSVCSRWSGSRSPRSATRAACRSTLIAVERLLSISGEDTITVDRKYREHWTGRLPTRFVILTNELPQFYDASGALASRFIILTFRTSFYGRENQGLTDELLGEAAGDLQLVPRKVSTASPSAATSCSRRRPRRRRASGRSRLAGLGVPARPLRIGADHSVDKQVLYAAWKRWCDDTGLRPGSATVFGRDLLAAIPLVGTSRPRDGDERRNVYVGIRLKP